MYTKTAIAAVFGMATMASALPSDVEGRAPKPAPKDTYVFYKGDGSVAAGWPDATSWSSFESLFAVNIPLMKQSCGNLNDGANDSDAEIADIKQALIQISKEAKVDRRVALAIMMQESKGCVRVKTTANGVRNPGLFQSHNGAGDCTGKTPCPADQITQMFRDGLQGTKDGPGIAQLVIQARTDLKGAKGAQAVYGAARIYNSGRLNPADLNDKITATACYSVDVANRLTGWTLSKNLCEGV